jgi:hypothetical protein
MDESFVLKTAYRILPDEQKADVSEAFGANPRCRDDYAIDMIFFIPCFSSFNRSSR